MVAELFSPLFTPRAKFNSNDGASRLAQKRATPRNRTEIKGGAKNHPTI
jgi:hypothetical protein